MKTKLEIEVKLFELEDKAQELRNESRRSDISETRADYLTDRLFEIEGMIEILKWVIEE